MRVRPALGVASVLPDLPSFARAHSSLSPDGADYTWRELFLVAGDNDGSASATVEAFEYVLAATAIRENPDLTEYPGRILAR
jgi:hypothetical protein